MTVAAGWGSPAQAAPPCAPTATQSAPGSVTAGSPCWTDVSPYPFGFDGNPVAWGESGCTAVADVSCYLRVTSFAFRAWNRGLAAVTPTTGGTTPFGVWLYNGTRWFPDPTFPGPSVCSGTSVLWAGKLDYWLVGAPKSGPLPKWPALCRFDGANYEWEPLAVPQATVTATGATGAITSGTCFAWNNCWFFGTGGATVHWDGQSLIPTSTGLGPSPWLSSDFTAAVSAQGAGQSPFGLAVTASGAQPQPDGSAAPQLLSSAGGLFAPAPFSVPASNPTDLVALAFDGGGNGWVAGDPSGANIDAPFGGKDTVSAAPLVPISPAGVQRPCAVAQPSMFMYHDDGSATSYLWSSISVLPGGDAIAGGMIGIQPTGRSPQVEPVLAQASCIHAPAITQFRVPDPNAPGPGVPLVPADPQGHVTAVAASATNDVWAATTPGLQLLGQVPPHLYLLTDGQAPLAPAGDDRESRPVVVQQQPSIFQFAPPVVIPAPPPATTVTHGQKPRHRTVRLPSPIYAIQRPRLVRTPAGRLSLTISFRVRRTVRIGLEALHGHAVVSFSGLKTFTGTRGALTIGVDPKRWPTGLKFVIPHRQPR